MPLILTAEHKKQLVVGQQYDPNDQFGNIFSWTGTVFSFVIHKPTAWILICVHLILWSCWYYHTCLDASGERIEGCTTTREWLKTMFYPPSLRDLAPLIAAFTFGMVFYLQSSYGIYRDFYFNGHQIAGAVKNMSVLLRATFRQPEPRWSVVRYLVVSQHLLYHEVNKRRAEWHGSKPGDEDHPGGWDTFAERMEGLHLMTGEERDALKSWEGNRHMLLYSWSLEQVREELDRPLGPSGERSVTLRSANDEAHFLTQFTTQLMALRDNTSRLHQMLLVPIPFPYYHLVETMVFFVLLLMAYSFINLNAAMSSTFTSHISIAVFPITVLVTNGIIEMANMMQDPLGDDVVDFNHSAYTNDLFDLAEAQCLFTAFRSAAASYPKPPDGMLADEIDTSSPSPALLHPPLGPGGALRVQGGNGDAYASPFGLSATGGKMHPLPPLQPNTVPRPQPPAAEKAKGAGEKRPSALKVDRVPKPERVPSLCSQR